MKNRQSYENNRIQLLEQKHVDLLVHISEIKSQNAELTEITRDFLTLALQSDLTKNPELAAVADWALALIQKIEG